MTAIKIEAEKEIPFWMKIYADLLSDTNSVPNLIEAAEYYRKLHLPKLTDACLDVGLIIISEHEIGNPEIIYLKKMIDLDYLRAREIYCKHLFESGPGSYTQELERQLLICKNQGSDEGLYWLGRVYHQWGRYTEAIQLYREFLSWSTTSVLKHHDQVRTLIGEVEEKITAMPEEARSESSFEEFIEVEVNYPSEDENEKPTEESLLKDPDVVGQAVLDLLKGKKINTGFYCTLVSLLGKIGTGDEILGPIITKGAERGSTYCLRILGKKWLKEQSGDSETDIEEVCVEPFPII